MSRHSKGPGCRPRGGGRRQRRNGSILWGGSPRWGRDCSRSSTPGFILKAPKIRARGKLPTAEGGEQMLSAHSRKLETRHPAAHQLSRRGPPLAPTSRPVARWGAGSVPASSARTEEGSPEKSNCDPRFLPRAESYPFLEQQGRFTACWANLDKTSFPSGPQYGGSGKWFTQGPSGFSR